MQPVAIVRPYDHAPRLPEGEEIDPRALLVWQFATPELELGPGRGWFMFERLEAMPTTSLIGLEIRRKWATVVDDRLRRRGFGERARVFAEDARLALPRFRAASFHRVYVHFPDPWWKKRHQKRLLLTEETAAQIVRVLEPGGELFVQTDVVERADAYELLFGRQPGMEPFRDSPRVEDNPYGARSPREKKAMADALPVVRLRFRRVEA
jgi:tRNA (guanine-N7-)-methyltransferase